MTMFISQFLSPATAPKKLVEVASAKAQLELRTFDGYLHRLGGELGNGNSKLDQKMSKSWHPRGRDALDIFLTLLPDELVNSALVMGIPGALGSMGRRGTFHGMFPPGMAAGIASCGLSMQRSGPWG